MSNDTTQVILSLFQDRGHSLYGGEAVSQLEHALQAAYFAEQAQARPELICAALLHDIGHLLHALPDCAPDQGIDDAHEVMGNRWLKRHFGPAVCEPIRLHVAAKRYLCSKDSSYLDQLSKASVTSLRLQGGIMSVSECMQFESHPYFQSAIQLRYWDDSAKIENMMTPPLEHYVQFVNQTSVP